MKKAISVLLKIGVSVALLVYLFRKINPKDVWQLLLHAKGGYLLAGLGIYIIAQAMCAYRWQILARVLDFRDSFRDFVVYYFSGMFLNLFLPTAIGGDIGKCYFLAKGKEKTLPAILSVLADRGAGLIALTMIALASLNFIEGINIPSPIIRLVLLSGTILIGGSVLPFFAGNLISKLGKTARISLAFWQRPLPLFQAIGMSLFFQSIVIVIHILVGLSLGLSIPIGYYFLLIPLAAVVSMFPVSLNGLGLRENAYVYLLSLINIPDAEATAFAFGWLVMIVGGGLIGGIALFINSFNKKP